MYSKEQQLKKNRLKPKPSMKNKSKITQHEKDYLTWLNNNRGSIPCCICGTLKDIEYHHITDIKRIKGKRRDATRVIPICGIEHHRLGKKAIHVLSKEEFYKNVMSLEDMLKIANNLYERYKKLSEL